MPAVTDEATSTIRKLAKSSTIEQNTKHGRVCLGKHAYHKNSIHVEPPNSETPRDFIRELIFEGTKVFSLRTR